MELLLLLVAVIVSLGAWANAAAKDRRIAEFEGSSKAQRRRADAAEAKVAKLETKHSEAARRIYERAEEKAGKLTLEAKDRRDAATKLLADAKRTAGEAEREVAKLAKAEARRQTKEMSDAISAQSRDLLAATRAAEQARDELTGFMERARLHANEVVAEARRKAERLVGAAAPLNEDAAALREMCSALRRRAEGYSSVAPMPFLDLLSQWGGGLDGSGAPAKLAKVRGLIAEQVRLGVAVRCDGLDDAARQAAQAIVRQAFDAEVDRILLRVKVDNFKPLSVELRDRFVTVNGTASALGAEVTDTYLRLRTEEVAVACAIHGLKEESREEQRRIRDEAREEERARREAEAAKRSAAREEATARNAVEEVRLAMSRAAEADRDGLERRLAELQERLEEAEARGRRAVSLAQQTRSGHVYVISNVGSFGEDVYKIGMTRRFDPTERVRELGDASVPFEFDIHGMIYSDDAPALEKALHRKFAERQVNLANPRKEFFRVPLLEIEGAVRALGIGEIRWTRAAAATQWRESAEIALRIGADPASRSKFLADQELHASHVRGSDDDVAEAA